VLQSQTREMLEKPNLNDYTIAASLRDEYG
jgi:hypothetical protein